jgi:hypothetical protein
MQRANRKSVHDEDKPPEQEVSKQTRPKIIYIASFAVLLAVLGVTFWVFSQYRPASGTDFFVAGREAITEGNMVATVWKNGESTRLSDGANSAYANSVFASGTDVYVAGFERLAETNWVATLWTNGEAKRLSDANHGSWASAVFKVK